MEESTECDRPRAKRQKKDKFGRMAALQRLRNLKGSKNKYEVNDVDDVYETVDEKEYTKRVLDRNEDWIVDDDGSGYVEDGRDIFDDDLDSESIAAASKQKGSTKKKKKAVSEAAGKGNLQFLLSSMPSKKKEEKKLDEDDLLSELISELDEPSTSAKGTPSKQMNKSKNNSISSIISEKQAAKNYMKSFSLPKKVTPVKPVPLNQVNRSRGDETSLIGKSASSVQSESNRNKTSHLNNTIRESNGGTRQLNQETRELNGEIRELNEETRELKRNKLDSKTEMEVDKPETQRRILKEIQTNESTEEIQIKKEITSPLQTDAQSLKTISAPKRLFEIKPEDVTADEEDMDELFDDYDMTQIEDIEMQAEAAAIKEEITEEQLLKGWETMQEGTANEMETDVKVNTSELPLVTTEDGKQVFRFFWWDACESKAGTVLLFGKTYCESAKAYVSCCVTINNIDRKVYLLPRTHHLDNCGKPTEKPVALIDVYHEFNSEVAEELQIKMFKSRKVTMNYCFDPEIPAQSEYLEVKYPASNYPIDRLKTGRTFSKVFGVKSSFLELFLLERKIKGPCWLDVENPKAVTNPVSWCKFEIRCDKPGDVGVMQTTKAIPSPPPLVVAAFNLRTVVNSKTLHNEIVMISCLVQTKYFVDKQAPKQPFEQHFCVIARPTEMTLPVDLHEALRKFKATQVQKMDSERALLNYFLGHFARIDPDLIVGHDLQGYQMNILAERLMTCKATQLSRLSKLKRSGDQGKSKLERELFLGRLVCDMKTSARELIKSRSFDLGTLCQTVLRINEDQRIEIETEDVPKMLQTSSNLLKLVGLTMQDTAFILKMMYELNVIPLALQITNIAGNVMSRTLMGGRSERNEFLLLHAFSEKEYIVPDKIKLAKSLEVDRGASKKKPTYSGGLVLDPKVGFYDKLILLMDFNSLYPSIIQEYNICFTTISGGSERDVVLPDQSTPPGILPTEIRKLVESRREVKKLMNNPDISNDLRMQYNIRQMALKLTANSMYGCLGFSNSRFYAKNLASLVTQKGREILTNTRDLVQKMSFDVIYGDTDSIMINTNILDYDQVFKIGSKIKQEINKLYRQVELDIDGVFKYLLLLKKKKYAAVTLTKGKNGELREQQEHKGIDIVRRDWSQLAAEAGKMVLNHILSDQSREERVENIHAHLRKLKEDLEENRVPLPLLVITKQLTKDPKLYSNKNSLPHVQVALRYNQKGGKPLRAGDTVPYVICNDGTSSAATQRAYHLDELKNTESLSIDTKYYLSQQIHPVVSRLCEPIEETDAFQIAECLGLDSTSFKKPRTQQTASIGDSIKRTEMKFRNVSPFTFKCISCKTENKVALVTYNQENSLSKCANPECVRKPVEYLPSIQNQLTLAMRTFIEKYYLNELTCEDPACTNDTIRLPLRFVGKYPVCTSCHKGVMYRKYTEGDLYEQLSYYQHVFDLAKVDKEITLEPEIEFAYNRLKETVEKTLKHSGYFIINLDSLFSNFSVKDVAVSVSPVEPLYFEEEEEEDF